MTHPTRESPLPTQHRLEPTRVMTQAVFQFDVLDTLMLSNIVLSLILTMLYIRTWLIRARNTHVSFHCDISVTSADVVSNQFHPFHVCWRLLKQLRDKFNVQSLYPHFDYFRLEWASTGSSPLEICQPRCLAYLLYKL